MDAAPYMMTNVNTTSSTAPALLSTPHHQQHHHHHSNHPQHSIQIQYQSPPINHSVPLLATPILMDTHCLTSTPSGTFVNPARITSDNNDPQQLQQQQHVMILGMVATQMDNKGYSSQDQLVTNVNQSNQTMDASSSSTVQLNGGVGLASGFEDGDQLRTALRQQLEYYFSNENLSHDVYLLTQMDSEQYVPISIIAGFDKVRKLTDDMELIVQVLRESQVVQVDETGTKVKPIRDRKGVLILREIVDDTTNEEIKSLFEHESCPRFVDVEYICNRNWYVTFDSDEDAQRALKYLTEHVKDFKGRPLLARIKARTTIQAYSGYSKNGARSPVLAMGSDQVSPIVGRQTSSDGGTAFVTTAPVQGYSGPYFQPPTMLQTWAPGATACYDLSSVINFNGLSPQLAYKPITASPGPRQQYNRSGYQRKNYYNHHNGPRNHSVANNSSYHYNPHLHQQQQQPQTAPLVTVPHTIQTVVDNNGGYLGTNQEPHYVVNGNIPTDKGLSSANHRVSAPVPPSSHSGPPVTVNAHSSVQGPGMGYQTHNFSSIKPPTQPSVETVTNAAVVSSSNYPNNPYHSSGPRMVKQHSRTTQQLNYQVPEFVPSSSVIPVTSNAPTSTVNEEVITNPTQVDNNLPDEVSPTIVSQPITQPPLSNGNYNSGAKGTSKGAQSTSGSFKGAPNRNRGGRGDRGGYRRDGDNVSNCSGTSGHSENYSRNGEDRNNGHRRDRRDHHGRDRGRNQEHQSHSNEVVIPPSFDLKDAAFPPLPFSIATNDPIPTMVNSDVSVASVDNPPPVTSGTCPVTSATGCLADVVKGISISKNECNKSEASQKPFDSSSNSVIDGHQDAERKTNSSPHDPSGTEANTSSKSSEENQNRWVRPPRSSNPPTETPKPVDEKDQNGLPDKMVVRAEEVQPCNGHESSDTDDPTKCNSSVQSSSKLMSFADVARLAKSKQSETIASSNQRNSVGKESISSIASSTPSNPDNNVASQKSSSGQNSRHSNHGASGREGKEKGPREGHRASDGDNSNSRPPRERRDRNKGSRRGGGGGAGGSGNKDNSRPGSRQSVGSSRKGEQVR